MPQDIHYPPPAGDQVVGPSAEEFNAPPTLEQLRRWRKALDQSGRPAYVVHRVEGDQMKAWLDNEIAKAEQRGLDAPAPNPS